jgi:hypothetical protein
MPSSTLTAADLGTDTVLDLLERDDPEGVLSIFADGTLDARAAEIDLRNRLAELERRVGTDFAGLLPELPAQGRGRALFVPLSGAEPTRVVTQLRLPNRVVLDERPFVHPLLECIERGRPAGVVLLASDRAELLEWRHGTLLVLAQLRLDEDEPRPAERRVHDRRRRFADEIAAAVRDLADRKSWERLLVSGGALALPKPLSERVIHDPRQLIDLSAAEVERAIAERLDDVRAEHDRRLVERVLESGAALGLSEVAAALNEARVAHLLYDPAVRHAGAMTPGGRLVIPPERDPLGEPLQPEPRLTERMVERCLATGARISPVQGAAAAQLADAGGVAARLRW